MTSAINPNYPVAGNPTTASVRANFATAQNEITALQDNTQGAPFLPLAGGRMNGAITLANDPVGPMQPVTLGYFQANAGSGGGGGGGGIPEAPADGTLYGRQDGAWMHAVDTAELSAAVSAAPYLPVSGGNMAGAIGMGNYKITGLALATNPTDAASKSYVDTAISGAAFIDAPSDGHPYLRINGAWRYGVAQLGASNNIAVVERTTGQDRTPTIAGNIAPYNNNSDGLILQAKQLAAVGSAGQNGDGPAIALFGPSQPANANCVSISTGNNGAGFNTWLFGSDGTTAFPNSITITPPANTSGGLSLVKQASGQSSLISSWMAGALRWRCFLSDNTAESGGNNGSNFQIQRFNDSGAAIDVPFYINRASGQITLANGGAIGDPLSISVGAGQNARIRYGVSGQRNWSCGIIPNGNFAIADETVGATRFYIDTSGNAYFSQNMQMTSASNALSLANGSQVYSDGNYFILACSGPATASSSWRLIYDRPSGAWYMSNYAGVTIWRFDGLGSLTLNGTLTQGSDARDKENLEDTADGLALVRRLLPKRFNRIVSPDRRELGFVAQDVADVLPEAVTARSDDKLAIDITPIIAVLANAVKELDARIATLETKGS